MTKKCLLDWKVVCRKLTNFGPPNYARILQGPSLYAYQEILLATWAGCSVPQPLWLCWEKLKLSQTKTKRRSCRFAGWKTETVFLKNIEKKITYSQTKGVFWFLCFRSTVFPQLCVLHFLVVILFYGICLHTRLFIRQLSHLLGGFLTGWKNREYLTTSSVSPELLHHFIAPSS